MSDEPQTSTESTGSELAREERRLERLRLVTQLWPTPDRFDDDPDPGPEEAA
jgi:hypothetical protein